MSDAGIAVFRSLDGGEATAALSRAVAGGRVSHCLLFSGPGGSGRKAAARALAAALLCPDGGCGHCAVCRRVLSGNHPDAREYGPDGRYISIDKVREIQREMSMKPFEASRRVFIIEDVEALRAEGANAFLKSLEEPHPEVFIVLLTKEPAALLETILSRAQLFLFSRPPAEEAAAALALELGLPQDDVAVFVSLAGGDVNLARLMAGHPWFREARGRLWEVMPHLDAADPAALLQLSEELVKGAGEMAKEAGEELDAEVERLKEIMQDKVAGKRLDKEVAEKKKRLREEQSSEGFEALLTFLESFLRDMAALAVEPAAEPLNADLAEGLRELAGRVPVEVSLAGLQLIARKRAGLPYNVNRNLLLDHLLFEMKMMRKV